MCPARQRLHTGPSGTQLQLCLTPFLLPLCVGPVLCPVVLACRSQSKGDDMVKQLRADAKAAGQPEPHLEVSLLDLSSLESVRSFVARWGVMFETARGPEAQYRWAQSFMHINGPCFPLPVAAACVAPALQAAWHRHLAQC